MPRNPHPTPPDPQAGHSPQQYARLMLEYARRARPGVRTALWQNVVQHPAHGWLLDMRGVGPSTHRKMGHDGLVGGVVAHNGRNHLRLTLAGVSAHLAVTVPDEFLKAADVVTGAISSEPARVSEPDQADRVAADLTPAMRDLIARPVNAGRLDRGSHYGRTWHGLMKRGLIDADGRLTPAGRTVRARVQQPAHYGSRTT